MEGNFEEEAEEHNTETKYDFPLDLEISLHALTGWTTVKIMRVTARIGTYEVTVLIDSDSTHNFISDKVVSSLQLPKCPPSLFMYALPMDCH